jgi:YD repeat-containing protein
VTVYVENFLAIPTGLPVPVGLYDQQAGQWVGSDHGTVVKILSVTGGLANLDVAGSGTPANASTLAAMGIDDTERQQLAGLYQPGQTLWRVQVPHFTAGDFNFPWSSPGGSTAPNQPNPVPVADPKDKSCPNASGSSIECERQVLGEQVDVVGTPFQLTYSSDRVPGHKASRTLKIPLSGPAVSKSLLGIVLEISVAGRQLTGVFDPKPNQSYTFTWDGLDAYGRKVVEAQPVTVRVGYVYPFVYVTPAEFFAAPSPTLATVSGRRGEDATITYWQVWHDPAGLFAGNWDARAYGLGGWTLDVLNAYSVASRTLYLGDGTQHNAQAISGVIQPAIQIGGPRALAAAPDGSLYIATGGNRVSRLAPDGSLSTVPETNSPVSGDAAGALTLGSDGSLYVSTAGIGNVNRVRRVFPDGHVQVVAGNGTSGYAGDGGPAIAAQLNVPQALAMGADGSLYIADPGKVRRVGPDGIITTVAGNGNTSCHGVCFSGDGGPATAAQFANGVAGLAVGPDGSIYLSDTFNHHIRRVTPDGLINTFAGSGSGAGIVGGFFGDGGPATAATLNAPAALTMNTDGSVLFYDFANHRIRRVAPDGTITTVAGNGTSASLGDAGPALAASLNGASGTSAGIAIAPDGSLFIADVNRIRVVRPVLPGSTTGNVLLPSPGGNTVNTFDGNGRHVQTFDALTGVMLFTFTYDVAGRLTQLTDGDGNLTTIERDSSGNPTAIVAPFGQRTALSVDSNGFLSQVTDPASSSVMLTSTPDGLLTTLIDPRGGPHHFGYDDFGLLTSDSDPAGGVRTLLRTDDPNTQTHTVVFSSPEGRKTTYRIQHPVTNDSVLTIINPDGTQSIVTQHPDGTTSMVDPDGTTISAKDSPDPRWGMAAPIAATQTVKSPAGLTQTTTASETVSLSDPANPLSVISITESTSVNGQAWISAYSAATHTITDTSPVGRTTSTALDTRGRVSQVQLNGLAPTKYSYDARGALTSIVESPDTDARMTSLAYDQSGNLQ